MPPQPAVQHAFNVGEKVLAYHGPLIHEASVKERDAKSSPDGKTNIKLYLLTYDGWNSHWDEWVPESRVLKADEDGRALQQERVRDFHRAHKRKNKTEGSSASSTQAGKKPKQASGDNKEEEIAQEMRDNLRLPHGMKLKLIEDWERITREKKLVPVPRAPSINNLLEEFQATKARRTSHERLYGEVCEGLRSYFNQALPTILLYKYERRQHRELSDEHKANPVDAYGAEHLLRLFVKLPELLAKCNMQREHLTVLVSKLMELLRFMQANKSKYFVNDYSLPDAEYIQWWASECN
jgi:mortality factor 4-like protein 1